MTNVSLPVSRISPKSHVEEAMESMQSLDAAGLRAEIIRAMSVTAESFVRMAAAVRILEDRGEDLSDIPQGMLGQLRRIAYGQLLPDVVAKYHHVPMLLSRLAMLPMPDQERLAHDEAVDVAMVSAGGHVDRRRVPLGRLSRDEVNQVFGRDGIRDEAGQVTYMRSKGTAPQPTTINQTEKFFETTVDVGDPIRSAINKYIDRRKMPVSEFAKRSGVGYSAATNYLSGRATVRSDAIVKMILAAGIKVTLP